MKIEANCGFFFFSLSSARQLSRDIPTDATSPSDKAMGRDARKIARIASFIRKLETNIEQTPLSISCNFEE